MKNQLVADILYQIADLLDLKGEIFFKTRAYRMAAQKIEVLDEDIEVVSNENRLRDISGVGEALAKKIKEVLQVIKDPQTDVLVDRARRDAAEYSFARRARYFLENSINRPNFLKETER